MIRRSMPSFRKADSSHTEPVAVPVHESLLAELYDLDIGGFTDDLAFYEQLARAGGGPVLELGVGTGRVAHPLARAGIEVWGIDTNPAMLARAGGQAGTDVSKRIRLVPADMRGFRLDRRFALIFAAFGTFHHLLTTDDQLACLRCVERHLTAEGLFVCDLRPVWFADWEEGDSVPLLHEWTRVLGHTGETVMKLRSARADLEQRIQHETHVYDCIAPDGALRRVVTTTGLRYTTPLEMVDLLGAAGLVLERRYGAYDLSPFDDDSELMITVARTPGAAGKEAP